MTVSCSICKAEFDTTEQCIEHRGLYHSKMEGVIRMPEVKPEKKGYPCTVPGCTFISQKGMGLARHLRGNCHGTEKERLDWTAKRKAAYYQKKREAQKQQPAKADQPTPQSEQKKTKIWIGPTMSVQVCIKCIRAWDTDREMKNCPDCGQTLANVDLKRVRFQH